jgi:O-methyltransferase
MREGLARLEGSTERQRQALHDQGTALAAVADRLARLEQQVSGLGTQLEARLEAARGDTSHVRESLLKFDALLRAVGRNVKRARRTDKDATREFKGLLGRLARLGAAFDVSLDARFMATAQPLVEARRTMLGYDRLFTLWQAAGNTAHLDLPAVEVGTFRGGSAALLSQALTAFTGAQRELHVVDTFEGHLDSTFTEHDPELQRGKFRSVGYEDVREYLAAFPGVCVYKGDAASVVSGWPDRQYCLVHIDVDLYRPTLECLEYFGPRLAEGGIIVLDDYEAATCPGVSRAAREYLTRMPAFQTWRLQAEQAVLVKRSMPVAAVR